MFEVRCCNVAKHIFWYASESEGIQSYLDLKFRLSTFKKSCFICFDESPLEMRKNAFYFILKAFFRSQEI